MSDKAEGRRGAAGASVDKLNAGSLCARWYRGESGCSGGDSDVGCPSEGGNTNDDWAVASFELDRPDLRRFHYSALVSMTELQLRLCACHRVWRGSEPSRHVPW